MKMSIALGKPGLPTTIYSQNKMSKKTRRKVFLSPARGSSLSREPMVETAGNPRAEFDDCPTTTTHTEIKYLPSILCLLCQHLGVNRSLLEEADKIQKVEKFKFNKMTFGLKANTGEIDR